MSKRGRLSPAAIERAVAEALAESNGTLWDLTPEEHFDTSEDVYHRDARAVLRALRDLGILKAAKGR